MEPLRAFDHPPMESDVAPTPTSRPEFDPEAFARESEERLAILSDFPDASSERITALPPTRRAPLQEDLMGLLELGEPF